MSQEIGNRVIELGYWANASSKDFRRGIIIPYDSERCVIDKFKSLPNAREGLFKTVYTYDSENQDESTLYGDLYFDFDDPEDFEKVRDDALTTISYLKIIFRLDYSHINIFFSGRKGVHITVNKEYLGIEPHKYLNLAFKYIVKTAHDYSKYKTLDLQIYDTKRLFRIENSKHEKTGFYKVPITYEELSNLSIDKIKELAKFPRVLPKNESASSDLDYAKRRFKDIMERHARKVEERNLKGSGNLKYTPPCIKLLLEKGANEGARNNTIAVLSSFYKNKGMDYKSALELVLEWNSSKNSPPSLAGEVTRTARSIYSGKCTYGCTYIKTLGYCEENNGCKFNKKGR